MPYRSVEPMRTLLPCRPHQYAAEIATVSLLQKLQANRGNFLLSKFRISALSSTVFMMLAQSCLNYHVRTAGMMREISNPEISNPEIAMRTLARVCGDGNACDWNVIQRMTQV
jgi:hypothetical protein